MPVRGRSVVGVGVLRVGRGDVGARGGDERGLVHPVADAVGPAAHRGAQRVEVALDVVEDAEVDQGEAARRASLDLVDRSLPRIEVDLGRRRRREDEPSRRDADPCGVAVVERPVLVLVGDLVRRRGPVPGSTRARRLDRRRPARSSRDGLELAQSSSNASPYSRRALVSSRLGSTRCGAPISETCTVSPGCSRTSAPAAPAWSRWMWERRRCFRSPISSRGRRAPRGARGGSRRAAIEEREALVGLDEVRGDAARVAAVQEVEGLVRHAETVVGLAVLWWRVGGL